MPNPTSSPFYPLSPTGGLIGKLQPVPASQGWGFGLGSWGGPETMPLNPAALIDGMGQYIPTADYPMTPAGQAGIRGLGSCGCGCAGNCDGMGTLGDGTGFLSSGLFNGQGVGGSGLFEGGFNVSTFGPAEWAALALGAYVVWSVVFTTKKGMRYASTVPTRTRRAARSAKSAFL